MAAVDFDHERHEGAGVGQADVVWQRQHGRDRGALLVGPEGDEGAGELSGPAGDGSAKAR